MQKQPTDESAVSVQVSIATSTTKNVPVYNLTITLTPKAGRPSTSTLTSSFAEWFDAQGRFVALPFQTLLASNVAVIGQFDPKRANRRAAPPVSNTDFTADEVAATIVGKDTAKTSGSAANKGAKRRKA